MTRHEPQLIADGPDLQKVMHVLGHELVHAAELLRRYERAALDRTAAAPARRTVASELQLVDLVIQILEDVGPFSRDLAHLVPSDCRVPRATIEGLRLDQLRAVLSGEEFRDAPHRGGDIDVF